MKRPEGFDGTPPQPAKPARRPTPKASAPKASALRAPAPRVRTARAPQTATAPASGTPRGREKANLRSATRERRQYERREVRRFTKRTRHRRIGWLTALGLVVLLGGILAVAVYSPVLALRTITIEGASAVKPGEVRAAIDGQLGTPLALLDYGRIRTELDAFPLIRSFVTEIVPPSTLVVHIVERAPVGAVATASGFAVVDPAGVVLDTTAQRREGIPLIDLGADGTDSVAFSAVVDVLLALPESIRAQVDVARATSKDDVRLILTGVGQRVVWGSAERSALKARVLQELMAAQGGNAHLEYDVSAPLSPVVRPG